MSYSIREIKRFELVDVDSNSAHDVDFIPTCRNGTRLIEVWLDGAYVEDLPAGTKCNKIRAMYYVEEFTARILHDAGISEVEESADSERDTERPPPMTVADSSFPS